MKKEFLQKYIEGNCTDQEKEIVADWLDSNPKHMKEYFALRKLYDITLWQTSWVAQKELKPTGKNSSRIWKPFYTEVIKIAAVLVFGIFISYFLFSKNTPENHVVMQTLYVPAGQRAEISLEDGTKVWLNANTKLIFPNQFSGETREVQLDGEGFFDVAPGKSKPFIVKSEKVDVKVWGTRFNLMAYSGSETFETSLLEGSVEVIKSNSSKGVMLHPNERISLVKEQLVISPISNMNHFLWKEGIISFDNESFPELVDKLELYFDIKIQVKNEKILSYKCTGKFRTKDGIEHILKVLQLRNNFSYRIDEKLNKITIK